MDKITQQIEQPLWEKKVTRMLLAWLSTLFLLTHSLSVVSCTAQMEPAMSGNGQPQDSTRVQIQTTAALGVMMSPERTDAPSGAEHPDNELITKAKTQGRVRVIVRLKLDDWKPEGELSSQQATAQREAIAHLQTRLLQRMASFAVTNVKQFKFVPQVVLEVDAAGVKDLLSNPEVIGISEDVAVPPTL